MGFARCVLAVVMYAMFLLLGFFLASSLKFCFIFHNYYYYYYSKTMYFIIFLIRKNVRIELNNIKNTY
jgi:hypothetical protein